MASTKGVSCHVKNSPVKFMVAAGYNRLIVASNNVPHLLGKLFSSALMEVCTLEVLTSPWPRFATNNTEAN